MEATGSNGSGNGNNIPLNEILRQGVDEIERHFDDILSAQGKYMAEAKRIRGQISDVKERLKALGVPKKELNAVLKRRDIKRKFEKVREEMELEAQELLDSYEQALGDLRDTPLGEAAVSGVASLAEERRARKSAALDVLDPSPAA